MKSLFPLAATWVVFFSFSAHAAPFDYVELQVLKPSPVIKVQGTEKQGWNDAQPTTLHFKMQARGKCNWGYRNTFVSLTLDTNKGYNGGLLVGQKILDSHKNKAMTWSSGWKELGLSWKTNQIVQNQAVAACQDALAKRVEAGEDRSAVLAAGDMVTIAPASLGLHFSCDDYGLVSNKKDIFHDAEVSVQCQAIDMPKPMPVVAVAEFMKPDLKLTHVNVTADPENYHGVCPKDITFTGHIHNNGVGGEMSYRFLQDGKALSGFQPLHFAVGQNKVQVSYVMAAKEQAQGPSQPLMKQAPALGVPGLLIKKVPRIVLEVKSGQQTLHDEAAYAFTCQKPLVLQAQPILPPSVYVDITSQLGIALGQQFSVWGGSLQLSRADASVLSPHGCSFRMAYDVVNTGTTSSGSFTTRLRDGATSLHSQTMGALHAGASVKANGMITLKPGSHMLHANLDDAQQVQESNEGNNAFRVHVNVAEDCGNSGPLRLEGMAPRQPIVGRPSF